MNESTTVGESQAEMAGLLLRTKASQDRDPEQERALEDSFIDKFSLDQTTALVEEESIKDEDFDFDPPNRLSYSFDQIYVRGGIFGEIIDQNRAAVELEQLEKEQSEGCNTTRDVSILLEQR